MSNIEKPHLLPYDDDYVLVSKRRLTAWDNCLVAMAIQFSAIINQSYLRLTYMFMAESIKATDNWTQERLDKYVEKIIVSYNQDPKKSA